MHKNTFFKNLPAIYGFGKNLSLDIFLNLGLNTRIYPITLKKKSHVLLMEEVKDKKKLFLDKKLKTSIKDDISFITFIRTYKGIRHLNNLPSRGQRTRTNAKTRKKIRTKTVLSKR